MLFRSEGHVARKANCASYLSRFGDEKPEDPHNCQGKVDRKFTALGTSSYLLLPSKQRRDDRDVDVDADAG